MAKGFVALKVFNFRFCSVAAVVLLFTVSCSKPPPEVSIAARDVHVETFAIENSQLKNCHFKDRNPIYHYSTPIAPNPILCDEGVAKKVELLSNSPLPNGILFSMNELSLVGTANEKITSAPFEFYVENEAGYQILKLQLTVR